MHYGSIVIPYYQNSKSDLITDIVPCYIGVKSPNIKICKPPKNAPPSKVLLFTSKKYLNNLDPVELSQIPNIPISNKDDKCKRIRKELLNKPYDVAFLLLYFNKHHHEPYKIDFDLYQTMTQLIGLKEDFVMNKGWISVVLKGAADHHDNYQ
jgi:hypothetical protein